MLRSPASIRPSPPDHAGRWAAWLAAPEGRDPATGHWLSWRNAQKQGFSYEEATAWVVRLAALLRGTEHGEALAPAAAAGAERLVEAATARGGLGLRGRLYAFDTAVGLAALDTLGGHESACARLETTLTALVEERRGVEGGPRLGGESPDTRWSEAFGAHLLWANLPLLARGRHDAADALTEALLETCATPDGTLRIHGKSERIYAHAAAYAATGLRARGDDRSARVAHGTTRLLLTSRNALGLVPAWLDVELAPARADATAQAAWLGATSGDPLLETLGAEARDALSHLTSPAGGLRYEPGSDDVNTCATAFALEAAAVRVRVSAARRP